MGHILQLRSCEHLVEELKMSRGNLEEAVAGQEPRTVPPAPLVIPTDHSHKTLDPLPLWHEENGATTHQRQKETGDGQIETERRMHDGAVALFYPIILTAPVNIVRETLVS